jgi:Na+-transporting methylmalonyl-CoA/oxaloacetate decarboxylase gamma subunit
MDSKYEQERSTLLELPILKHFDESKGEIALKTDVLKKGEKSLFWALAIGLLGIGGYLTWTYIIPPLFTMLGQAIALSATGVFLVFLVLMFPVIMKGLRFATKNLHKALIQSNPFNELEEQKQKMIKNREVFKNTKAKLKGLKNEMEIEAGKSEKEAKDYQEEVLSLQRQAEKLKSAMDEMVKINGIAAKDTDEYVTLQSELARKLSDSQRISTQYEQSKSFIQKYGVRANVLGKMDRKLTLAGTAIDIKIADFDATVKMLQKEYEFAKNAKAATESAKSAMMFTKDWELEYALEVVTSTIAQDIARTSENLIDIDALTSKYSVDNDELYARLDSLADEIKTGENTIPDSNRYTSPNYKLSKDDKLNNGGFGDIF